MRVFRAQLWHFQTVWPWVSALTFLRLFPHL